MALQRRPGREYFMSLKLDDPERKNLIAEEADFILQNELWTIGIAEKVGPEFFCEEPFLTIFRAYRATWAGHNDLTELMRVLRQHKAGLSTINKIVCFSLGSPQSVSVNFKYAKSTVWRYFCQYTTALELAKLFREFNGGKEAQVFAQDPNITPVEINAFPKVGITIVNSRLHKGFGLIDPNTFVFSITHRTSNLKEIIMATSQPAGMIFTPNYRHSTINKALQEVCEEYNEVHCDALTSRWATFEGQQIYHPLGWDAKLFLLKKNMTPSRKRKLAESMPRLFEREKSVRRKACVLSK
ncbi:hypothetical protein RRF57_001418 [Xylaria bambusicola]|uniref:SRR1-like domain-containing protein n=1 Tax=Xylaria bambusicola TaxID=326684 RepID=A0AAN7Z1K7_9PEZI